MNTTGLYNTAHPLAESGKPIFIPFGEWPYDKTTRQRLDREHGEAIANELNERVARGEPGIPVYQGHPDVPDLAAKYPDKGALGWVTKIALANEDGKDGLALTVEWDRDPGKGFKWFSPYWFANEKDRDGQTYIVANIRSIGLVNNPNIPEFRLANEVLTFHGPNTNPLYKLPEHLMALAKKFDERRAMANVIDANGMGHGDDGKFDGSGSGGGSASGGASGPKAEVKAAYDKYKEAEAKFKKWWNPDRKFSEGHNSVVKNYNDAQSEFSKKFRQAYGKPTPNGWGGMTLDEIDKAVMGSGGGGGSGGGAKRDDYTERLVKRTESEGKTIFGKYSPSQINKSLSMLRDAHSARKSGFTGVGGSDRGDAADRKSIHAAAIKMGFKYNRATHQYE